MGALPAIDTLVEGRHAVVTLGIDGQTTTVISGLISQDEPDAWVIGGAWSFVLEGIYGDEVISVEVAPLAPPEKWAAVIQARVVPLRDDLPVQEDVCLVYLPAEPDDDRPWKADRVVGQFSDSWVAPDWIDWHSARVLFEGTGAPVFEDWS